MSSPEPAPTELRSTVNRRQLSAGLLPRLVPGAVVLVIVAVTVTSVLSLSSARTLIAARDGDLRADELVEIQAELSWLHHDLLVAGVLAYQRTGTATRPEGFDRLQAGRADLAERLDGLAATGDAVGEEAAVISRQLAATPIDAWPVDLWSIERLHYETMPFLDRPFEVGDASADPPEATASTTGSVTTADLIGAAQAVPLPRLVLLDALALDLTASTDPLPPWADGFLTSVAATVAEDPGWFGPDPDRPLADHIMGPPGAPEPVLVGAAAEQVSASLDLVAGYDRWLVAGGADTGPPPASIEELAAAAERATGAMVEAVRAGFEINRSEHDTSVLGEGPVLVRLLVGGLSAVLAVGLIGFSLTWWNRRRHHLADAAYSDALTGAGNRRFLDDVVAGRLRRSGQTHVVAMLDMDRFKLVNDTWGHDAGDALLQAMSQRLHQQVDAYCASRLGSGAAVVRLGGDEFVVVVHGPIGLDVGALEQRLRSAAGPVDLGLDEPIELAYSLGTAASSEPCDLADLLKAADLATYEDKQRVPTRPLTGSAAATGSVVVDVTSLEAR